MYGTVHTNVWLRVKQCTTRLYEVTTVWEMSNVGREKNVWYCARNEMYALELLGVTGRKN